MIITGLKIGVGLCLGYLGVQLALIAVIAFISWIALIIWDRIF